MFSGREQGPDLMNRTPSFSSILLFSFDAKAVRIVSTCDDNGTPYVTIQPPQVKPLL